MSHEVQAGQALLAGFVSGAAGAFATAAIVLRSLSVSEVWRRRAASFGRVPLPLLGVVLVNGLLLSWTLFGLVLGAAYLQVEDPVRFGVAVDATLLLGLLAAGFVLRRITAAMWGAALVAALAFGVLLPVLADS